MASKRKPILKRAKYRSKLEDSIADQLDASGLSYSYESVRIPYTVPSRAATYRPDFVFGGIHIEVKGYFRSPAERQKLALVKEQYPDLDLRLVFSNANKPIYTGSPTTMAMWAESHGIPWADKGKIPKEWLNDAIPPDTDRS